MDFEELDPVKSPAYEIGSDLSKLSVDELRALIETLREEVLRIEKTVSEKVNQRSVADDFFKS